MIHGNNDNGNTSASGPKIDFQQAVDGLELKKIMSRCRFFKRCGHDVYQVLMTMLTSIFMGARNLFELFTHDYSESCKCSRDAVYRLAKNPNLNWSKLMLELAVKTVELLEISSEKRRITLIVDDSPIHRNCAKKTELSCRFFDHVEQVFAKGFLNLVIGVSDGTHFIPCTSDLMSSQHDANLLMPQNPKTDMRTNGGKRRRLARMSKMKVLLQRCEEILKRGIRATHLLADSWFFSSVLFTKLKEQGLMFIVRAKSSFKFIPEGGQQAITQERLFKQLGGWKALKRHKVLCANFAQNAKKDLTVKLVFVANYKNNGEFITLVTNDMTLTAEEVVSLYARRWEIEPCFKACKQFLGLSKESQAHNFDTICAMNTIAYVRYIILTLMQAHNDDPLSIGGLFQTASDSIRERPFVEALKIVSNAFLALPEKLCQAGIIGRQRLHKAQDLAQELLCEALGRVYNFISRIMFGELPELMQLRQVS